MIDTATRLSSVQEYYFSRKLREVRELAQRGKPIINLGIGSPDLSPHASVIEAISKCLYKKGAHKYQAYKGLPEFRNAIAEFYQKKFNTKLHPEKEILPLMGSKEGIMHISMAFLNKGDAVLVPNPGYPTYSSVTNLLEAKPIYYELDESNNYQVDFGKLEKLDLSRVKLMWVNYPHMPTGANASDETFSRLIDFGKRNNLIIVNDNPYSFILNDNPKSVLEYTDNEDNILELNSLSKTFNMAGWRVGMLVGNADLLNEVLKVKTQMDSGMFHCIQKGAIAALQLNDDWYTHLNTVYKERRKYIWQLSEQLNCKITNKDASGMFVWAKLKNAQKSENVVDKLLYEKDIFIAPGTVFGTKGEGYIRFSLCMPKEQIIEAIERCK